MRIYDLIRYIVWYATQHEIALTTVRLVKFLYLADLYYARTYNGETLTKFPWAFVHYGPYCTEAMEAIEGVASTGIICKRTYESKFANTDEFHIYTCHDEEIEPLDTFFPIEALSPLQVAIKKYGEDTAALLDHVYFETEPMIDAKPKERLDFTSAKPIERSRQTKIQKLSKEKIELARNYIRRLGEKAKRDMSRLKDEDAEMAKWKDEVYYSALEYFDDEDLQPGLKGIARIVQ